MGISYATIRRRYDIGLDSIVALVGKLEDEIERLVAIKADGVAEILIERLTKRVTQLETAVSAKEDELHEAHHQNVRLLARVRELERAVEQGSVSVSPEDPKIKRDSHNSNRPPALDPPWDKPKRTRSLRQKSGLRTGGQFGHPGVTLRAVKDPDERISHGVDVCERCGASIIDETVTRVIRRQVFEIREGKLAVTEHAAEQKTCSVCGATSLAKFPAGIKAPVQYGVGVMARAVYLHIHQLLPVARTQEAMRDLFGCSISQASIIRAARICSDKLVGCEQRIKAALADSPVMGADETGIRIAGVKAWVHVARTDRLTHLAPHSHRGRKAFDEIGIIGRFKGTLVRDGWFSYRQYRQCEHGLCNAHLLRNLVYVIEAEPRHSKWAESLAKLLVEMKEAVSAAKSAGQTSLAPEIRNKFRRRYEKIVGPAGDNSWRFWELADVGPAGRLLLRRFSRDRELVLRFLDDFSVPFDNNGAERDLRMLKLQQKTAGCFRTVEGATMFCRVRSYLSSARKQGLHLLRPIDLSLRSHPVSVTISP